MGFQEKDKVLHCEDVSLQKIADAVGTPAYVYSAAEIKSQYDKLKGAMEKALPANRQPMLCYAAKANSNIAVLRRLQQLGAGLEIVSQGELIRGLKAGFDPARIVMTGVGKQTREIEACLEAGIHQFNVESIEEIYHLNDVAKDMGKVANVVFRINPDVTGGGHSKISTGRKRDKFGITMERVFDAFDIAIEMPHVQAHGMSVHIGSQVFDVSAFREAFEKLPALVEKLRAAGHEVTRLDIGGGFPIVYDDEKLLDLDEYASWVADIIEPLGTEIIMEPGRYLVGNAGVLLTKVIHIKKTQDRDFLVIDTAMNDLIRPTLYDAYHGVEPVANRDASLTKYDVVGPICETGDTFSRDRDLPEMRSGDLAVVKSAGAYGFCMASNYNTRPMPPEVMVHGDEFEIIRPRQSYEDIIDLEIIPDWLK